MYIVEWKDRAERQLAAIWLAATDRNAVTMTSNRIDQELARRPLQLGESRASSVQRILIDPPLGVEFEVIEDDKRVIVQFVYPIG